MYICPQCCLMGKLFPWVTFSLHTRNQESQDAPHSNALGFIVLAETVPQKGQGCNRAAGLLMVTVAESVLDLDPELWVSLMWGLRRIPTQASRRLSVWHALATMTSWLLSGFSANLLQTVTLAPPPPEELQNQLKEWHLVMPNWTATLGRDLD